MNRGAALRRAVAVGLVLAWSCLPHSAAAAATHTCSRAELGALFAAHLPLAVTLEGDEEPTRFTLGAEIVDHVGQVALRSPRGSLTLQLEARDDSHPDFARLPSFRVVLLGSDGGLTPTEQGRVARQAIARAQTGDDGACTFPRQTPKAVAAASPATSSAASVAGDGGNGRGSAAGAGTADSEVDVAAFLAALALLIAAGALLVGGWRRLGRRGRMLGAVGVVVAAVLILASDRGLPSPDSWACHAPDPALGEGCWQLEPGCAGRWEGFLRRTAPVPFAVNADGHRGPAALARRPQGSVRVAVFGASVLAAYGVPEGQSYRAHAAKALSAAMPGKVVEVLNFAVAGDDVHKQLLRAERRQSLAPDLWVFSAEPTLLARSACRPWWDASHGVAAWVPPLRRLRLSTLRPLEATDAEAEAALSGLVAFAGRQAKGSVALWSFGPLSRDPAVASQRLAQLRDAGIAIIGPPESWDALQRDPALALSNDEGFNAAGHAALAAILARGVAAWERAR